MSALQAPLMEAEEFLRLSAFISGSSGLLYEEKSNELLVRRLRPRVDELGMTNFIEYVERLQRDPDELQQMLQLLVTRETYFFRQQYQLDAFVEELLPRIVEASGPHRRLTVWSAGCSTGEEAYTLAIILSESTLLADWRINIVATDLCRANIEAAERGIYRSASFRTMSEAVKKRYFRKVPGGFQISDALRKMVHFSPANLVSPAEVRAVGRVDVVFCRNVLIYFEEQARRLATKLFYERLLPGGYLLLGHSESLLNAQTSFEPVHLERDLVYRRPELDQSSDSKMKVAR